MIDFRIVFNEQSGRYRVERRRWWGWGFVLDRSGEDYATFDRFEDAQRFVCARRLPRKARPRRWRVVDNCTHPCADG